MHAVSFIGHWGDLLVAGIVLEMAWLGAKMGLFRGVVLGMQSMAACIAALAVSGRMALWLAQHAAIPPTTALGVVFLSILAATAIGMHYALHFLIAEREVTLPPMINKIGGGLGGGLAGISFAGAILIAWSMLPIPAALRIDATRLALDAGAKMLNTFARCLEIEPRARERLLDAYRLAAWNRPKEPAVPEPMPEPEPEPEPMQENHDQNGSEKSSIAFKWGLIPSKDLSHWKVERGEWCVFEAPKDIRSKPGKASGIRGEGNSRLTLGYPLPNNVAISFKMRVRDRGMRQGMRPAVFLKGTDVNVWLGNDGVGHTLVLLGIVEPKRPTSPLRYSFNEDYDVSLTLDEQRATLRINGQEISSAAVTNPRDEASDGLWLTLSSGDSFSPGEVEFWDLRIAEPVTQASTAEP